MYYALIGTLITVIIGVIVSYLTQTKDDEYDSKLLHPLVFRISQWLPGKKPYYIRNTNSLDETTTKTIIECDNLGYEKHPDDKSTTIITTDKIDKNSNPLEPTSTDFKLKPNVIRLPPHPDIMETKHWNSKDGVYKKTEGNDSV